MSSPILVTGGTGTLGQLLVPRLRDAGREVRVLSRRAQPAPADPGVSFVTGDLPHLVYISIVGADLVKFGYIRAKLDCERLITESGLPWTVLRATQFFDLVMTGARPLARLPIVPAPAGFLVQPCDADEVAARLADLTLAGPAGRVPDFGGPEVLSFADLLRGYLLARHQRRPVVALPTPGIAAIRSGGLLVLAQSDFSAPSEFSGGKLTWAEFLSARLTPARG